MDRSEQETESMQRDLRSFKTHLQATNKAPSTIETYLKAMHGLSDTLGDPATGSVTRDDLEGYFGALLQRMKPATVANRFRSIQQFFRWWSEEFDAPNPMAKMRPPAVPEIPVPVIQQEILEKLLKATSGKSFEDRRDHAILRLFIETGMRLAELSELNLRDVDLDQRLAMPMGKGRRPRPVVFSAKTAQAIDRYLRLCPPDQTYLWKGLAGRLTPSGVAQVVARRCREIDVPRIHPHQFRHTFASRWLSEGGEETDLMRLAGWRSRTMLMRYAADTATERAIAAAKRMQQGDTL